MAFGEFYVEQQGWAHWPKVLIMCRKRSAGGIERKRYIPEREYKTKTKEECAGCPDEHEAECRAMWTYCWKDTPEHLVSGDDVNTSVLHQALK